MNNLKTFLYLLFLIGILLSCEKKADVFEERWNSIKVKYEDDASGEMFLLKSELLELIKNVENEIDFVIIPDYYDSKSFIELREHSYDLLGMAIELFEDKKLGYDEKKIIIYAIQNVEFDIYKYFLHDLAIKFLNDSIDENIVMETFFPFEHYRVVKNYKDPVIRSALKICLKSKTIGKDEKELIKLVLKGTLWKELEEYFIMTNQSEVLNK